MPKNYIRSIDSGYSITIHTKNTWLLAISSIPVPDLPLLNNANANANANTIICLYPNSHLFNFYLR